MKKAPPKKAPGKKPKAGRPKLLGEESTFGLGGMTGSGSKGKAKCREKDGSPCKGPGSHKKEGGTDYALLGNTDLSNKKNFRKALFKKFWYTFTSHDN